MIGKIFNNRYEIKEKIGAGGTSIVYKGQDMSLGRSVTIKILREEFAHDSEFVRRFQHEAHAVASLSHGNIVGIYDVGFQDNMHYIVMEFVEGETLKQNIARRGPLPVEETVSIMYQILDGIEYAHEHGIIHRDIKAQNILFANDGRVKVTDFGIAVGLNEMTQTYNNSTRIMGSVHYIAPEQVQGLQVDERTDIYAAGVVMYEMLTGKLPFTGDTPISIAMKHVQAEILPPHQLNPMVPIGLSYVVLRAMRKAPGMRYNSAKEMAVSIYDIMEGQGASADNADGIAAAPNIRDMREKDTVRRTHKNGKSNTQSRRKKKKKVDWGAVVKYAFILVLIVFFVALGWTGWQFLKTFFATVDVEVPNVVGKPLEVATSMLQEQGLTLSTEWRNSDTVDENVVISQSSPAGQMVREGKSIELYVSLGMTKTKVPPIVGKTRIEAEVSLYNSALQYEYGEDAFNDEIPAGSIISVTPAVGESIAEHSTVILIKSKGVMPIPIPMPSLIGKTLAEAQQILADSLLILESTTHAESFTYVSGLVIGQSTAATEMIEQGSSVKLVVSSGPGVSIRRFKLTYMIPTTNAQYVFRIDVEDESGVHTEYEKIVKGGENMLVEGIPAYGDGVAVVYLDGERSYVMDIPKL